MPILLTPRLRMRLGPFFKRLRTPEVKDMGNFLGIGAPGSGPSPEPPPTEDPLPYIVAFSPDAPGNELVYGAYVTFSTCVDVSAVTGIESRGFTSNPPGQQQPWTEIIPPITQDPVGIGPTKHTWYLTFDDTVPIVGSQGLIELRYSGGIDSINECAVPQRDSGVLYASAEDGNDTTIYGPNARYARTIDENTVEIWFDGCVSVAGLTGIEVRVNGGAWTEVTAHAQVSDMIRQFGTVQTLAFGDVIEWRYSSPFATPSETLLVCFTPVPIPPMEAPEQTIAVNNFIPEALSIHCGTPPDGVIGQVYAHTVTSSGGWPPVTIALQAGVLPGGLTHTNGVITGTPTTEENQAQTWRATDDQANTADCGTTIQIWDVLQITTTTLPNATIDAAYSQTLAATGGKTPYSWTIVSGSLPAGLSLNSSTGEISGTPTTEQTSNFTVRCADADSQQTDTQALSIEVLSVALPDFHAMAPDANYRMQGVLVGTGGLTEGRTADLLLPDKDGIYRTFGNAVPGIQGGRFVSEDEVYADDPPGTPLAEVPFYVSAPAATNYFLNSHAPVTQAISGLTGEYTCWLEGSGTVTLSGGATGVVSAGNPVVFTPTGDVTFTVAGGPLDFVQVEDSPAPTMPIITTGAAVTRDDCDQRFDAANHATDLTVYYFEIDSTVQDGFTNPSNTRPTILCDPSRFRYGHTASTGTVTTYDGSTFSAFSVNKVQQGLNKLAVVYTGSQRATNLNNVWAANSAFDGNAELVNFLLFHLYDHVMGMRNLRRYDVATFQEGKDLIDELMS